MIVQSFAQRFFMIYIKKRNKICKIILPLQREIEKASRTRPKVEFSITKVLNNNNV